MFNKVLPAVILAAVVLSVLPPIITYAAAPRVQEYTETYDPGSLVDGAGETNVTIADQAALGDACIASFSLDIQDLTLTCYVQAAGLVETRLQNESTATVNLASGTLRVYLFKRQG